MRRPSQDWIETLEIVGFLVAICGGIPLAAFGLAVLIFEDAVLVGPFLLMSPVLAIGILLLAAVHFEDTGFPAATKADGEIEDLFNDVGSKLGIENLSVRIQPEDGKRHNWPIDIDKSTVVIFETFWNGFHVKDRKFLVAYSLVREVGYESVLKKNLSVLSAISLVACLVATQNLWSIIPMHSVALVTAFLVARHVDQRKAIAADARALKVTQDYPSARRFIAWHLRHSYARLPGNFQDRRLEALRNEAIRLELI